MTTATNNNKLKYVFPLKSNGDLTVAIRLLEVLGLKQGDYKFNTINGSLEVIKDDNKWEEFLTNKIKELGFEKLLEGKSYTSSNESRIDSFSDSYTYIEDVQKLCTKISESYKDYKVEFLETNIDHSEGKVKIKFKYSSKSKINAIDYAVALSIYNRQYYTIDSNGMPVMFVDDLINSIQDKDIVEGLKVLRKIFL